MEGRRIFRADALILCKVVDNFGDIGVAHRLAREISRRRPELRLAIAVSDLAAFSKIAPEVRADAARQNVGGIEVVAWDLPPGEASDFREFPPPAILECFQCGRPEWLEEILFAPGFRGEVQIVNIDYLTAEEWADEFHLLKSGTRSAKIHKVNFMPGFTPATGGLLLDGTGGSPRAVDSARPFTIPVFTYEMDFSHAVGAIAELSESRPVLVRLAQGRSARPFLRAWEDAGRPFPVEELPFMRQEDWDEVLMAADFAFVRGEDSMARACLSGRPFAWHAYVQDDDWQLVKVDALLARLAPHFPDAGLFSDLAAFWRLANGAKDGGEPRPLLGRILRAAADGLLDAPFGAFARSLRGNGDMADNLLAYIGSLGILRAEG